VSEWLRWVLGEFGYRVLPATRPSEALEIAKRHGKGGEISVLVSDIVMPQMSGPELAERLQQEDPELKVLFLSGYSAETVRERGGLPAESGFLEKPFDDISLLRAIRSLLDRSSSDSGAARRS
jgi:CheY-like chemotaxis protein